MADGTLFGNLRKLVVADLFCGLGGTSLGVEMALGYGPVAAVNHWSYAIQQHSKNHPQTHHFQEDVFAVEPWIAARGRSIDLLVGSPDCTHFSVAKGAAPRDSGRRGLADVFVKWARQVKPRVIILENVREFTTWGPLDDQGQPIKERAGEEFARWKGELEALGYVVEYRLLRACDYGAPTSRLRLFVIARCDGKPIQWPAPSHGGPGQPAWRCAAECVDWSIPVRSIFGRSRPLAEATMKRIAQGVQKYVLQNPRPFLLNLSHGGRLEDINEPLRTTTTTKGGERALIAPTLVQMGYGDKQGAPPRLPSIERPIGTVTSGGNKFGLAAAFLAKHYTGAIGSDLRSPMGTVTSWDHHSLVSAFLCKYYGSDGQVQPVDRPLDTATCKARFGLVTVDIQGEPWEIVDIGMRMLAPRELARAQGFPDSYQLEGSIADQIAGIGNSVVPQIMAALVRTNLGGRDDA